MNKIENKSMNDEHQAGKNNIRNQKIRTTDGTDNIEYAPQEKIKMQMEDIRKKIENTRLSDIEERLTKDTLEKDMKEKKEDAKGAESDKRIIEDTIEKMTEAQIEQPQLNTFLLHAQEEQMMEPDIDAMMDAEAERQFMEPDIDAMIDAEAERQFMEPDIDTTMDAEAERQFMEPDIDAYIENIIKEIESDPFRVYLYNGLLNYASQNYTKAIPDLKDYIKKYPDDFTANYTIGKALVETGRFDDAYVHLSKIVFELTEDQIQEFLSVLERYKINGRVDLAKKLLMEIPDSEFQVVTGYPLSYKMVEYSDFEKEQYKTQIEREKANIEATHRREKERMIQQYSHTLANTLNPNTIFEVANRLKKHAEFQKDARFLTDAYHAETIIRNQGLLLQARNTGSSAEFQQLIRGDRLAEDTHEKSIDIEEILNSSVQRIVARFLNANYRKLELIRTEICNQQNTTLDQMKADFEENVFFNPNRTAIEWASANIGRIEYNLSLLWNSIRLRRDGYSEALLQGYFQELLFNALKYRDNSQDIWVKANFTEEKIKDTTWLIAKWTNPFEPEKKLLLGTGKGLEGMENDIRMLNLENDVQSRILEVQKTNNLFTVMLYFRRDLFVPNPPLPKDREKTAKALSKRRAKK